MVSCPISKKDLLRLEDMCLQSKQLTGTPTLLTCVHFEGRDLLSHALSSRIGWLVLCMIWLSYVYPRSHSGWIGPVSEFKEAVFRQPAYRYSISLSPDLLSMWRNKLAFPMPFRTSDLFFVCFDWLLYTPGPIPAELVQLANLKELYLFLSYNKLTGNHPFFPPDVNSIWRKKLAFFKPFHTSVTCFLYVLTGFCIPQVPFRLNWANWRIWRSWVYPTTSLPVIILIPD
jgi:hypothetical protein